MVLGEARKPFTELRRGVPEYCVLAVLRGGESYAFDIVRVLTMGGPHDTTHLFGSYAFNLGIESGDIPLGASVSLFMFPILAALAVLILRSVRRNVREGR